MRQLISPLSAVMALALPAIAQSTLVVPNGTAATEGNSSNAFPWGRGSSASLQMQCIYDSTHFTLQGINFPIIISRLRWRLNGGVASTGGSYSNAIVDMATAAVDVLTPSTSFAANMAPDRTNVYTGPVTQLAMPATTPGGWFVDIPLTTSFLYDPSSGNDLVIWSDIPPGVGASAQTLQMDVQTVASACRVYNSTAYGSGTGTINGTHGVVVELTYVPASGLYAGFSANVTGGPSPLPVQFTDHSYSSDPGGVTSWAWDFNGDSVIDSTLQNPTFTYNSCGSYNVSLTVTDASHSPNTLTRTGYIRTDQIAANFTSQVIGPLTVQFTDTSNMPATSWAWDLNGDNVVDSTVQNPVWVYPNANPVSLTVTRLCSAASTITQSIVPTQQLTTNLAANNGGASLWTVLFDVNVLNPRGVSIHSFDSITANLSTPFTVDVYLKPGSYLGSEFVPAAWTQVGTAAGTSNPVANLPSNAAFPAPLYVPAGSYGMALRYIGIAPRYVTLTAPQTYGNGDLSLTLGAATVTTGPFVGTTINTPRGWSGTIYYGTNQVGQEPGYGFFAPGCPGTLGVPGNTASALPRLGQTMTASLSRLNQNAAFFILGFSRTSSIFGPLPVSLTPYGAPGCFGRVSTDSAVLLLGSGNTATFNLAVPNNAIYLGMQLFSQGLALDTVNALGAVTSDAAGLVIGQ